MNEKSSMDKLKQLSSKGWKFVFLTLLLSVIPYYFILKEGDTGSNWTLLLMWMPGIAAIILRILYQEGLFSSLIWNPLKAWRWILLGAFIPFAIEIITILLSVGFGGASLREDFLTVENGEIAIKGIAMLFGASAQPWYVFLPNFILSYFVGTIFYSLFFALGEELGWRGYLQKEWVASNPLFSFLLIGVIWGWWHLPGILLGHNYPEYPLMGGFLFMPFVTILFSISFGVAFQLKRVIWVPVIFHGAVNISAEISNTGLVESSINRPFNDFVWTGLWLIATVLIWFQMKSNQKEVKQRKSKSHLH